LPGFSFSNYIMKNKFKRSGRFFAYIVECRDGTYYTGYTPNVVNRLELHNKGRGAKYTRDRRPVRMIWFKEYKYFRKAFLEEKRIKQLTRKEKEDLVNGNIKPKKRFLKRPRALIRVKRRKPLRSK
jgi:putative endonuclease